MFLLCLEQIIRFVFFSSFSVFEPHNSYFAVDYCDVRKASFVTIRKKRNESMSTVSQAVTVFNVTEAY
jgi:hypothetical protein